MDWGALHVRQDLQSLLVHLEAVRMIREDPSLDVRLLKTLEHWDRVASVRSKPLRDEWKRIITECDWALALEPSDRGQQLRQASPMGLLLSEGVKQEIRQRVRSPEAPPELHTLIAMGYKCLEREFNK